MVGGSGINFSQLNYLFCDITYIEKGPCVDMDMISWKCHLIPGNKHFIMHLLTEKSPHKSFNGRALLYIDQHGKLRHRQQSSMFNSDNYSMSNGIKQIWKDENWFMAYTAILQFLG